jgi:CheY-like chemotaxis protein
VSFEQRKFLNRKSVKMTRFGHNTLTSHYCNMSTYSLDVGKAVDQTTFVVVEDDMLFAEALTALVESLGYRVLATAASEPGAIKAVLEFQPDAVLMDVRLESGNGLSAARVIREKSQVPIIFCTSCSDDAEIQRAVEQLGNASLVDKLIDDVKLVALLENVLRASALSWPLSASELWPPTMVERIRAYARAAGVTRSEALRQLVELGLKAKPRKPMNAKRSTHSHQRLRSQSC